MTQRPKKNKFDLLPFDFLTVDPPGEKLRIARGFPNRYNCTRYRKRAGKSDEK